MNQESGDLVSLKSVPEGWQIIQLSCLGIYIREIGIIIPLPSPVLTHLRCCENSFIFEMLWDPLWQVCECNALFYFIIQYIISEAQETFGSHFGTCYKRNYYWEFQRSIKSHKVLEKQTNKQKIKQKQAKLSIETDKIVFFFFLLSKAHIHLSWNLYTISIRDIPISSTRSLGFSNFC